jgi:hypothetical protein
VREEPREEFSDATVAARTRNHANAATVVHTAASSHACEKGRRGGSSRTIVGGLQSWLSGAGSGLKVSEMLSPRGIAAEAADGIERGPLLVGSACGSTAAIV